MNIIIPIYFIFGLIVWRFKKEYLPIYCIYITTFGLVPLEILSPSIDGEGISLSFDACVKISAILLLLCMVINVVSRKDKKIFFRSGQAFGDCCHDIACCGSFYYKQRD